MKKKLNTALIVVGILMCVGVIAIILSFSGGFKGIYHDLRPLPDYSKGEPAHNREQYKKVIADYDRQLTALTDKQSETSYSDTCVRSQFNWKVKSDYLSSCVHNLKKMYLTSKDTCSMLPIVSALINAKYINDRGCTGANPNGNFNDVSTGGFPSSTRIVVINRQTALKGVGFNISPGSYAGRSCTYANFCDRQAGNYEKWPTLLESENYPTVILLDSSREYYRK